MNFLTILPVLTVTADTHKESERNNIDFIQYFDFLGWFPAQCSNEVVELGGVFETTEDEFRGQLNLQNYPANAFCRHVVVADESCAEIKVSFQSVAVAADPTDLQDPCIDYFLFGWYTPSGHVGHLNQEMCHCYGNGCSYQGFGPYFGKYELSPGDFLIDSNSFTFYFRSMYSGGHVFLSWQCVKLATTAPTTTTLTTTTTTTTTALTSCSTFHSSHEEFAELVKTKIEDALKEELANLPNKPGVRRRMNQFKQWFYNIFDGWYKDLADAFFGNRKCLTDKFPHDSLGHVDQESFLKFLYYHIKLP